jgi:hypothetical protein
MNGEPDRFFHARFIVRASEKIALETVRRAGDKSPNREQFVGIALPMALFAIAGLRMALEYVAHEIQQAVTPEVERESTFPICDDRHAFDSVMGSRFPGLEISRQDIWEVLLDVQPFSPGRLGTLPILNELWNHSKHVDLSGTDTHELQMTFEDPSKGTKETIQRYWLAYDNGRPLLDLLQLCVKDVQAVVDRIEPLVRLMG